MTISFVTKIFIISGLFLISIIMLKSLKTLKNNFCHTNVLKLSSTVVDTDNQPGTGND